LVRCISSTNNNQPSPASLLSWMTFRHLGAPFLTVRKTADPTQSTVYSHVLLLAFGNQQPSPLGGIYIASSPERCFSQGHRSCQIDQLNKKDHWLRRCHQTPGFCRRPSFQSGETSKSGTSCLGSAVDAIVIGMLVLKSDQNQPVCYPET
jgi:hypothetical protein